MSDVAPRRRSRPFRVMVIFVVVVIGIWLITLPGTVAIRLIAGVVGWNSVLENPRDAVDAWVLLGDSPLGLTTLGLAVLWSTGPLLLVGLVLWLGRPITSENSTVRPARTRPVPPDRTSTGGQRPTLTARRSGQTPSPPAPPVASPVPATRPNGSRQHRSSPGVAIPPLLLVDTETTGTSRSDRVIEIAWIATDPALSVVAQGSSLLRADGSAGSIHARRIHGISHSDLRGAPDFAYVWDQLEELRYGRLLAAHNAPFDRRMINSELRRISRAEISKMACTLELAYALGYARRKRGNVPGVSGRLADLSARLELDVTPTHRALADTETMLEVLRYFCERHPREAAHYLSSC